MTGYAFPIIVTREDDGSVPMYVLPPPYSLRKAASGCAWATRRAGSHGKCFFDFEALGDFTVSSGQNRERFAVEGAKLGLSGGSRRVNELSGGNVSFHPGRPGPGRRKRKTGSTAQCKHSCSIGSTGREEMIFWGNVAAFPPLLIKHLAWGLIPLTRLRIRH